MDDDAKFLETIYNSFNTRDIDGVVATLTDDVTWANGMDGYVRGRDGVREYWTRQWNLVRPQITLQAVRRTAEGTIIAKVRQIIRDTQGGTIRDTVVGHVFRLRDGKIARFDIQAIPAD